MINLFVPFNRKVGEKMIIHISKSFRYFTALVSKVTLPISKSEYLDAHFKIRIKRNRGISREKANWKMQVSDKDIQQYVFTLRRKRLAQASEAGYRHAAREFISANPSNHLPKNGGLIGVFDQYGKNQENVVLIVGVSNNHLLIINAKITIKIPKTVKTFGQLDNYIQKLHL